MMTFELKAPAVMSPQSRLWVYQCNRLLSEHEVAELRRDMAAFIAQWTSHGAQMDATAEVLHNCVVVVILDDHKAGASGCGIDKSVHFIQQWSAHREVDMMSRQTVIYREADAIKLTTVPHFWAMRKAGIIDDDTQLIDPTIQKWGDWPAQGWVSFKNSWHQMMWGR